MTSSAADNLSTGNPRRVLLEPMPVVGVRFANDRVYLSMEDGREIGAQLDQFPRLADATDKRVPTGSTSVAGLACTGPTLTRT